MEYDTQKIGDKIRQERKKKSLKQEDFAQALGLSKSSRQTIGNWENAELMPDLEMFFKICKVCECDMGYLLGEYDFKTKKAKDIYETIKLSEKATEKLVDISKSDKAEILFTFNKLIESDYFFEYLLAVHLYANTFSGNYIKNKIQGYSSSTELPLTKEDPKGKGSLVILSETLNCSPDEVVNYLKASSKVHIDTVFTQLLENIEHNSSKSNKHKARRTIPLFNLKKTKKTEV